MAVSNEFPDGITHYTESLAIIPVHWPNGRMECQFCAEWFGMRRIDGREVFWCSLAPKLGKTDNFLSNPRTRPEWCPLRDKEGDE